MEIFQRSPTQFTPKINFDPQSGKLAISGNSMPENSESFYVPLLEWTKQFKASVGQGATVYVNVKLNYYNSSSMRYLTDWFMILSEINSGEHTVNVEWFFEEGDDLMEEAGEELSSLVELPFDIKEIK